MTTPSLRASTSPVRANNPARWEPAPVDHARQRQLAQAAIDALTVAISHARQLEPGAHGTKLVSRLEVSSAALLRTVIYSDKELAKAANRRR